MSSYRNQVSSVSHQSYLFAFLFQICTLNCTYPLIIPLWSYKMAASINIKAVRIEGTGQGPQWSNYRDSDVAVLAGATWAGMASDTELQFRHPLGILTTQKFQSPHRILRKTENSQSSTEKTFRSLHFSENWPQHLFTLRFICSQSWGKESG